MPIQPKPASPPAAPTVALIVKFNGVVTELSLNDPATQALLVPVVSAAVKANTTAQTLASLPLDANPSLDDVLALAPAAAGSPALEGVKIGALAPLLAPEVAKLLGIAAKGA